MHTCMHAHISTCVHICIHIHIYAYIYIYTSIQYLFIVYSCMILLQDQMIVLILKAILVVKDGFSQALYSCQTRCACVRRSPCSMQAQRLVGSRKPFDSTLNPPTTPLLLCVGGRCRAPARPWQALLGLQRLPTTTLSGRQALVA